MMPRDSLQTIRDRIVADFISIADLTSALLRRGTVPGLIKALTGSFFSLQGQIDNVRNNITPNPEMDDEVLESSAFWLGSGMTRKLAEKTKGPVTAVGNEGETVLAGERLQQRSTGVVYIVDANVDVVAGIALLDVTAELAGEAGNANTDTPLVFEQPIPGIDSTATVASPGLIGGADRETNPELLARLEVKVRREFDSRDAEWYTDTALEVANVTRAWAFGNWNGPGTVVLFFMMDNLYADGIPLAGDVANMQAYIVARVHIGMANFTASAPGAAVTNFTILLTPNNATVQQAVEDSVGEMLKRVAQIEDGTGSGFIPQSKINDAVSAAVGVDDYQVTAPTTGITPGTGEIAVAGVFTFGAIV
ncbi:baseplate J/gp47 family protein [Candidatus Pacearchaeota archaeon]|nr:baseplate J/gp47 family protein [Candidatus Pacearchaeota archaeon]